MTKTLSLCSGYGGLITAVHSITGGELAAYSEIMPAASEVVARHWPDVPNLGDLTEVDWEEVNEEFAPDEIEAGFPCQDISDAGKRVGIGGSRSGIWKNVVHGISVIRPRRVFLENVAAIKNRGLDVVIADLEEIGYDLRWAYVKAAQVGAPHIRSRWFGLAAPTGTIAPGEVPNDVKRPVYDLLGTPLTTSGAGPGVLTNRSNRGRLVTQVALLKTPTANLGSNGGPQSPAKRKAGGHGPTLDDEVSFMSGEWQSEDGRDWEPAVRTWEAVMGRPAPTPAEVSARGRLRLSAAFEEWMMGLPVGWVTDTPGLSRSAQMKVIGNGVVPQQAEAAFRLLLK